MQTELQCLQEAKTWNIVERPSQKNVIPGKWVYKVKTKAGGSFEKSKTRYVAKVSSKLKVLTIQTRLLSPVNLKPS